MDVLIKSSNGFTIVPMETRQLSRRIITINGEITETSALAFTDKILELNLESYEPIYIFINSPGGEINSGLLMYDAIVDSKAKICMICRGKAYSMGAVLFTCADERLMLPNSELMLHQPLLGGKISGNASSIKSISDTLLETKERLNQLISAHTGKSLEEIDAATSFDHYFSPEEAVEFHLCDRIICFEEVINLINE